MTEQSSDPAADIRQWRANHLQQLAYAIQEGRDVEDVCVQSFNRGSLAWERSARLPTEKERRRIRQWCRRVLTDLAMLGSVVDGSMNIVEASPRIWFFRFDWDNAPPDWMNPGPPPSDDQTNERTTP